MNIHLMTRYLWEQRIDVNHLICLNCAVLYLSILKESFVCVLKHTPEIHGIEVTTHEHTHAHTMSFHARISSGYFFRLLVWNFRFNPKNRGRKCHRWGKPRSHTEERKNLWIETAQISWFVYHIGTGDTISHHKRITCMNSSLRCKFIYFDLKAGTLPPLPLLWAQRQTQILLQMWNLKDSVLIRRWQNQFKTLQKRLRASR